ncbi:FkbM family methyltransferase [Haloarchaeobius sp. HRN-SO-5]|uniref:FkbM family methyltransferase n=1 Tax=Haloarchaeobius sp. HRN-SO-5 TaxID=3446118 RepID=UPI003EB96B32
MVDATKEPTVRTRVMNGVAVPSGEPEENRDYHPDHEHASIDSLRRRTQRGDSVVVVGGGWGASTVVAARMTHFEGDVTTFEPSSEMTSTIDRTIEVNNVSELVTVEHASIGPVREGNERFFGSADGEQRPPTAIPECDVLELDCEGAELDILETLSFRPRVIIVEVHPHIGCASSDVKSALTELGYEIVDEGVAGIDDSLPVLTATRLE